MDANATGAALPIRLARWPKFVLIFGLLGLTFTVYELSRPVNPQLALEMSSSVPSVAQLFYNLGKGYNEKDSEIITVDSSSLRSFQKFTFNLPTGNLSALRFDPLLTEGTVTIRNMVIRGRYGVYLRIPPSDVLAFNQIERRLEQHNEVTFKTSARASDPGLSLRLPGTFEYKSARAAARARFLLFGNFILLGVAVMIFRTSPSLAPLAHALSMRVRQANTKLEQIGERLSSPNFIQFDSLAIWFYALCLAMFVFAIAADLNGSSIGMYSVRHGRDPSTWIGSPKWVRADEWNIQTPDILNQSLRGRRFNVEDSVIGGHGTALVGNLPVWHISTLFRPQFWSFFVLPLDYAYATYWQCKALILVAGIFTWLLLVTRCSIWAIAGALWYFFSPFTQWTYSWASRLPEMVGLICFTMVFACYLTIGRKPVALALAALGAAGCGIDFGMCAYLPHLIPLFWLFVLFMVFWCIGARELIFKKELAGRRVLALIAALVLTGAVGLTVYSDARGAVAGIANTSYPGKRLFSGGNLPLQALTSHFFAWTETEKHFPPALANISEASGFLWLAPATLFCLGKLALSRFQKFAMLSLWCAFLFLLAWLLLPIPARIGTILALNRTAASRCLPALGLANIAIVAICMASHTRKSAVDRQPLYKMESLLRIAGVFLVLLTILLLTNESLNSYFARSELLLASVVATAFVVLMFRGSKIALALALVIPQALVFGAVNPTERGLGPITSSALYNYIRHHTQLLDAKWMLFTDDTMAFGFFNATGCEAYNGLRYLPDIDHFPLLASRGLNVQLLNSAGFLLAHPLEDPKTKSYVEMGAPTVIRWSVSPLDPVLKQIGIGYVAFTSKPSPAISSQLIPLTSGPLDNFWLYRLP
jgi:hypothetical protein